MTAFHASLFGGIPRNADRATLRWLHREHLFRARVRSAHPAELTPAGHLNEAGRCRRAMQGGDHD